MTPVFLDTVGLVAAWNRSDQWHAAATAAFSNLLQRQVPLVTTSSVLLECGNEAARRPYRGQVIFPPRSGLVLWHTRSLGPEFQESPIRV